MMMLTSPEYMFLLMEWGQEAQADAEVELGWGGIEWYSWMFEFEGSLPRGGNHAQMGSQKFVWGSLQVLAENWAGHAQRLKMLIQQWLLQAESWSNLEATEDQETLNFQASTVETLDWAPWALSWDPRDLSLQKQRTFPEKRVIP